jgi:large subunit ribosomal protein L6
MSRIGKLPVPLPSGVDVKVDGSHVTVKGPKGQMEMDAHPSMLMEVKEGELIVTRPSEQKEHRALHGLTRSLINNMVVGVTDGWEKKLEIVGIGYRAEEQGKGIKLTLGFSHQIDYPAPEGITIACPQPTQVVVTGIDKQKVGQVAAEIRSFRPPEPYKGKGVRYAGEHVRRKAGKTAGA